MHTPEQIWQSYHQKLLTFIKQKVSHHLDAEDLLQEIFVKVLPKLDSLKDDEKLESWLFQITRNSIIDYYRTHKTSEPLPEWLGNEDSDNHIEEVDQNRQALSECLTPLINALPEDYCSAIQRSEINGLTQKTIAEQDNISISGAKSRVQRGRKLLKQMFNQCCEFELNSHNQITSYQSKPSRNSDCC